MRKSHVMSALIVALVSSACHTAPATTQAAILGQNWRAVAADFDSGRAALPTVLRGHAYLALNRPNDALCQLALLTDSDRHTWDEWTRAFVAAHDDASVAHYLRGDAHARLRQWGEALREFDRALAINPRSVLALNARGVVRSFTA